MKKIVLLVLTLATIVIADEEEINIQNLATFYETNVQTVKECLSKAKTTWKGMQIEKETWQKILNNEDDEETKKSITTQGQFLICMMEKIELMKDSKLVLEKIEAFEKKQSKPASKEVIQKCVNTFNEDVKLTQENKMMKFVICMTTN